MEGIKIIYEKAVTNMLSILSFVSLACCNGNGNDMIIKLLNSKDKEEVILGVYKAGESGKKEFVPLLLKNADDPRRSTNLRFKGITVYQAKMIALRKIFKQTPLGKLHMKLILQ